VSGWTHERGECIDQRNLGDLSKVTDCGRRKSRIVFNESDSGHGGKAAQGFAGGLPERPLGHK
ncbi:MAG: hypothetical protein K2Q19_04390, partial [Rhodocyclaceae bacterium]|nr:hypothetical protein [Rhodocyclaceae bacterium]